MTLTSIFQAEPPDWLYAWMARGSLFRRIYRRFVRDLAGFLPHGARVLDVGTGPGYLPGYLARERPDLDLWGVDFSYGMIRRARPRQREANRQSPLKWTVANALALPFPAATFDLAMATFSFHIWPRPVDGLAEMVRVTKPGGRAWIYEMRDRVGSRDLQAFAREEELPYPLIYLGFKITSKGHSLGFEEFSRFLQKAAGGRGQVSAAHHLFWRGELAGS